jgi:DNA-binding CsgD family transcriptional regulator
MTTFDRLVATVESIHAAGLEANRWPRALQMINDMIIGAGATFEVIDKTRFAHSAFHSFGIPPAQQIEYADHYFPNSPRVRAGLATRIGHIHWDYQILDEAAMRRDPFYADFLPQLGLRYSIAGTVRQSESEFAVFAIQRSPQQGHVEKREIGLMRRLVPHMQHAFDVARRLRLAGETRDSFERTLDWLADGVALIGADGAVIYANESLRAIARRDDGIRFRKGCIEFDDVTARDRFNAAMASTLRLRADEPDAVANDFVAPRSTGEQPYLIAIRPLLDRTGSSHPAQAAAIVFVRDSLARGAAAATLRELFRLTEAEAALAQALQSGVTLTDYAHRRDLSLNTAYTHLRHLREKTGCSRMAELIHKLNGLRLPLRLG